MPVQHRETIEEFGVEAVLLGIGDSHVELLRPVSADSAVGRFLERHGPGCITSPTEPTDIDSTLESVKAAGSS